MKLFHIIEARYAHNRVRFEVSDRAGTLYLIDGILYDVDELMEKKFYEYTRSSGYRRDPEEKYMENIIANSGDVLDLINTNKGFAGIGVTSKGGWNYEQDPEEILRNQNPIFVIPHEQFEMAVQAGWLKKV